MAIHDGPLKAVVFAMVLIGSVAGMTAMIRLFAVENVTSVLIIAAALAHTCLIARGN